MQKKATLTAGVDKVHCFLPLFMLVIFPSMASGEGTMENSAFLSKAISCWRKLETISKTSCYSLEETRDDIEHNPSQRNYANSKSEVFRLGGNSLCRVCYDNSDGTQMQNISCWNAKYSFKIARAAQTDPWQINNLILHDHSDQSDEFTCSDIDTISAPWSILGISLIDLVSRPEIKIISITQNAEAGDDSVVLHFEWNGNDKMPGMMKQLQECRVTLSPQHEYAVVGFEARFANSEGSGYFRNRGKCVYDFSTDCPILKSYHYTLIREKGSIKEITWTTNIQKTEPCTLSDNDFTLSAFGFSEPESPSNRIRYAFMFAGGLLIILGILVKYRAARQSDLKD